MKLERLNIQMLPGVEPGFVLADVSPACNFVTGPNAVGKSSLIRALRYLVGEATRNDPVALSLSATFDLSQRRITVRRTGKEIVWERDGTGVEAPALPDRDQLYCYWLSLEHLLDSEDHKHRSDESLINDLKCALSGGYDLEGLGRDEPFRVRPQHGHNEAKALRQTDERLRRVEAHYETLKRDESEIPSLRQAIEAAEDATARVDRLKKGLRLLEARRAREVIERGFAEFPTHMARLYGDESGVLRKLDERREALRQEGADQRRGAEDAERRLRETGMADTKPALDDILALMNDLDDALRAADRRTDKQMVLQDAEAAEAQALMSLGARPELRLEPETVSRAEDLARDLQAKQYTCNELGAQLAAVSGEQGQEDGGRTRRAVEHLRGWLSSSEGMSKQEWWSFAVAAAGGVIALALAVAQSAWAALIPGAVGVVAVFVLGWFVWSRGVERASWQGRFESCGIEPPSVWQRPDAEARLEELEKRLAALQEQGQRARMAADLRDHLQRAEQDLGVLESEKKEMADRVGFDPTLTAAGLDRFVRLASEHERTHAKCVATRSSIAEDDKRIATCEVRVRAFLAQWRHPSDAEEGLAALKGRLENVRAACERANECLRDQVAAKRERHRIDEELDRLDDEEVRLYERLELDRSARTELIQSCELLKDWRTRKESLRDARAVESERRTTIERAPEVLERVDVGDEEGMQTDLDRARIEAAGLPGLRDKLMAIKTLLADAGKDLRLEDAEENRRTAYAALEDKLQEALFADAATFLLKDAKEEYRIEHEPDVLRDARNWFGRFTHHSFELELDDAAGFVAIDTKQDVRRSLSEISSATRMQLLLAVRVAWARNQERGRESLPLFLDEALTTSDVGRFREVARSLDQLTREEGRQVFYLSARRNEVDLWQRSTGNRPHHIDLAVVRFGSESTAPEDYDLPEEAQIPPPQGASAEEYAAALSVPPVHPDDEAGSIHLFHVMRDELVLFHGLMDEWRIVSVGQLESLLRSSAGGAAMPEQSHRERLLGRCEAARAWVAAWRRGRGRTVDRVALESSGAVSDRTIERVLQLVKDVEGDGAALIEQLRAGIVSGFQSKRIERLEQWLVSEGFIDRADVLDGPGRERQALQEVAGEAVPDEIKAVVRWLEAGLPTSD